MQPVRTVAIMGMGYVGLTFSVVLAKRGFKVYAVEVNPDIVVSLRRGVPHFQEKGLTSLLQHQQRLGNLEVLEALPDCRIDAYVICVGTPLKQGAHEPNVDYITSVVKDVGGVAERLRLRLGAPTAITFLPVEEIGYSPEHMDFPGTRSLGYQEAIERWIGIGEKVHIGGTRKFVMLNAHGGNSALMSIVATELRVRLGMLAVATSWTRFAYPEDLVSPEERAIGIHGGFVETSVMLALRPDLVDMGKARDFPSAQSHFSRDFAHLRAYGPHAFGWKMGDLSPEGVVGNAAAATAEAGERILEHAVAGLVELMKDVERFDPALLK